MKVSILIEKDLVSVKMYLVKFLYALLIYLCLSSIDILIFLVRVSSFYSNFVFIYLIYFTFYHYIGPRGKESTEVLITQNKGKERENSYQKLKRSLDESHMET